MTYRKRVNQLLVLPSFARTAIPFMDEADHSFKNTISLKKKIVSLTSPDAIVVFPSSCALSSHIDTTLRCEGADGPSRPSPSAGIRSRVANADGEVCVYHTPLPCCHLYWSGSK